MSSLIGEVASTLFASSKNMSLVKASAASRAPHTVCDRLIELLCEAENGVVEMLCLRGNAQGVPMALDPAHVLRQLQLYGVSFLLRRSKLVFAYQYSCETFYQKFWPLRSDLPTLNQAKIEAKGDLVKFMSNVTSGCKSILVALAANQVDHEQIYLGKTHVFIRTEKTMRQLSRIAKRCTAHAATKIQAVGRMYVTRSRLIHHAMVYCHLDPAVDWQRETILMREEDALASRVAKALAELLWNSKEEVMRRRWERERNAAIESEVAHLRELEKQRKDERHRRLLVRKRGRAFRRVMIIKLQSHVRGMLSRRQTQCWIDCNELAGASRRSTADLEEALKCARETLLLWRGGTSRLEIMVAKARRRVAAARNVKARKHREKLERKRRPLRDPLVRGDTLWM